MAQSPTHSLMIGIIGGGAAGMSCALWLKQLGYTPIIIEKTAKLGGQLLSLPRTNRWVLGHPDQTSIELAETYCRHIQKEAIDVRHNSQLLAAAATASGFDVSIAQADDTHGLPLRAIVIATGARVISHESFANIPGFQALADAGLMSFPPIAHLENPGAWQGKTIAVIGGGDNAHFTAKDIALAGAQVQLLMRSAPQARPTIRREVEGLIAQGHIIEHAHTYATAFQKNQQDIEITLNTGAALHVDHIFARIGFIANCEFLDAFAAFSGIAKEAGYIKTDTVKRTTIPWVYAIGDIANARHQSVVNAIAEGAIAAQDLSERV